MKTGPILPDGPKLRKCLKTNATNIRCCKDAEYVCRRSKTMRVHTVRTIQLSTTINRTYNVHSICIVLLLRHKYSASLQHHMLVELVFSHLRYFLPSGRIGPVSTYQLIKKLKFWLTKGNTPIKLLVYTIFYYSSLIQIGMYVS